MKQNMKSHKLFLRLIVATMFLVIPLSISTLTCTFTGESRSEKETNIARDIQSTLNAEKVMTLEGQQTDISAQNTASDVGDTIQDQQATIDIMNTALSLDLTPNLPGSITNTPQSQENQDIILSNWVATGKWAKITNCPFQGDCWTDSPIGSYGNNQDTNLISSESTFIDPSWENPRLVFWMKLDLEPGYDEASVDIKTDENPTWKQFLFFKNHLDWHEASATLEIYKGQIVHFRFRLHADRYVTKDGWYLQNIRIVYD